MRGRKVCLNVWMINKNAQQLVEFLEQHPAIEELWHPALPTQRYERFGRKAGAYGGVLSFTLNFPEENTIPFMIGLPARKGPIWARPARCAVHL